MSFCTGFFCDKDNKTYIYPQQIISKTNGKPTHLLLIIILLNQGLTMYFISAGSPMSPYCLLYFCTVYVC